MARDALARPGKDRVSGCRTPGDRAVIGALLWIADQIFVGACRVLPRFRNGGAAAARDGHGKHFAVVSYYLPPAWSGGAIVLSRILGDIAAGSYCLVSRFAYAGQQGDSFIPRLPATYHHVAGSLFLPAANRPLWQWVKALAEIGRRAMRLASVLRSERVQTVVATTGDLVEVPAAFLAARITGSRFVLYVFDDFVSQWWQFPAAERMARRFERHIVRAGAGLVVPNEHMSRELGKRYGSQCAIVRNPTSAPVSNDGWTYRPMDPAGPLSLIYTGAVYAVNEDTIRNVLAAAATLDAPSARLVIYTAQTGLFKDGGDERDSLDVRPHVSPAEIAGIQEQADILLLPFTFDRRASTLIETSGTAKLADYLASGRPVLAVAPAHTFLSDFLLNNDCGFVCSSNDPADIARAVRAILDDQQRCAAVCANARTCAAREFSPAKARDAFLTAVSGAAPT